MLRVFVVNAVASRQSGLGLRRIGEKTITVIMFNCQRRRIEVMQIVLHCMGEAHLQYQHKKADRQFPHVIHGATLTQGLVACKRLKKSININARITFRLTVRIKS